MKSLARGHFWWPKLDQAIENMSKTCSICLETQHNPATAPLHVWKWPEKPWNRVHIDFAELWHGAAGAREIEVDSARRV